MVTTKQRWKCAQVVIAVRQKRLLFHLRHRSGMAVCVFEGATRGLCVVQFSQVLLNPMKTRVSFHMDKMNNNYYSKIN
jgi:hypothetical protein